MSLNKAARTLRIVSSAQITLTNIVDGYFINLSNDNFSIMCDSNGEALISEIGSTGKAISTITVSKGSTKLTAVNNTPTTNQYSISIISNETKGCTAAKKDTDKVYINTLTTDLSGKIVVSINIENATTIKKEITFNRVLNEDIDNIDGKFIFGSNYWTPNQNGTGDVQSNVKVVKSNQAIYGTNILEITNSQWMYSKKTVDVEPGKIYRMKFRVRQTVDPTTIANKKIYAGYTPFNSSNTAIGTNGAGNTYFASGVTQAVGEWKEYVSYFSTKARSAITNLQGKVVFPDVKAFPSGTVNFRPMFIVNYNGGNGIVEVDGWLLEDATKDFEVTELQYKATKIESDISGINLSVSNIKTITDMSNNPMTLAAKINYSDFTTENQGEFYLHGLTDKRVPADINGKCLWNNEIVSLPRVMFDPNGAVPDNWIIYIVRNKADNKWWSIWQEETETTKTWKRLLANQATDETIYAHTWNATNDIVVGYYIVKKTTPKSSEAPMLMVQLFDGALNYEQAINMSLTSSVSQIQLLEDEMELKVQKNNVIASINLYTQTNDDGTTSGVKIKGDKIDLQGQVTFSSLADSDVSGSIKNIFSQVDNKTVINGGMIQTNTIKGNDLNLKGNLTVSKTVNNKVINTFAVKDNGDIEIDGILKSSNFSESQNTGYKIDTDGTAIFNQAQIKGDVILARAGMTNHGGQIGGENVIINSNFAKGMSNWSTQDMSNNTGSAKSITVITGGHWCPADIYALQIKGTNVTGRYGVISTQFILKANTKYTISGYCAGHRTGNILVNVRDRANNDANIHSKTYAPVGGGATLNAWTRFETTFTTGTSTKYALNLYSQDMKSDGYVWFANIKLEEGDKATPWCPHVSEQDNHVRIWAGSEYDKRENAPFRVYQNGDIFATNGTFSGRVLGHIDSGNIHINNGEFVINSTMHYLKENEILSCNIDGTPYARDVNPNPYIMFSADKNFINTDLIFGTTDKPRIKYSNTNDRLDINVSTTINTGTTAITVEDGNGWSDGLNLSSRINGNSGSITFNFRTDSENVSQSNTLYIISKGGKGTTYGDICMRRKDWEEDFNLRIRGNLEIKNKITSDSNSIEMRANSDGWGFYVI